MKSNENFELEEMRRQMAVLKQKLQQQEILNERMTSRAKEALQKDIKNMEKRDRREIILLLLFTPLFYYVFVCQEGFSVAFGIFFSLFCLIGAIFTFRYKINVNDYSWDDDLVEAQQKVSLAKKRYTQSNSISYILTFVLIAWILWETYQQSASVRTVVILAVVYVAIMPFTIMKVMKRYRRYQKMLDQIAELTKMDE